MMRRANSQGLVGILAKQRSVNHRLESFVHAIVSSINCWPTSFSRLICNLAWSGQAAICLLKMLFATVCERLDAWLD